MTLDLEGEAHDLGLVRLHLETPAPRPGGAEQYFCSEISRRHRKYPEFELIYELTDWLTCMASSPELSGAEQAELGELSVDLAFGLGRQLGPLNADQVRDLMQDLNRTWGASLRGDELGLVQVASRFGTTEALVVCRPGSAEVTLITPAGWVRFRGEEARTFERLIQAQDALMDLEDERRDLHETFAPMLGALNARKLRAGGTLKRPPSRRVRDTAA